MNNVEIRRPREEDTDELIDFFRKVITDTFGNEGLSELYEDIENEINLKINYLKSDFDSNGKNRYFLVALKEKTIVGTIEYGPANKVIKSHTSGDLDDLVEVGTVFVHPEYQRQGIGNTLLNKMFLTLKNKGINKFCLDSGYTSAQKLWIKKFGEPNYLLKNFWGPGYDHMIWIVKNN